MKLADEVAAMTVELEKADVDREEVYTLLLRCMLELRTLSHRVRVLEDLLKNSSQ